MSIFSQSVNRRVLYTRVALDTNAKHPRFVLTETITPKTILRVLIGGFSLVMVLLITASIIGYRAMKSIQGEAARLSKEHTMTARLLNEIQVEQIALNAAFFRLAQPSLQLDRERLFRRLEQSERDLYRLTSSIPDVRENSPWANLRRASHAFSIETRRVIESRDSSQEALRSLFQKHDEVVRLVNQLVTSSATRSATMEGQIEAESQGLITNSLWLLGSCLLLASICALLTVRSTTDMIRRMEWQSGELSRVSWHMLQGQEAAARRFSHELHDELGQSLAAIRSNVTAEGGDIAARRVDTLQVVDEAIANVRELSQLLRPVILDDFGLDAALQWLTEKFSQRTRINVRYRSSCNDRLADETETHLFRIAQEALTNIARHSQATEVDIRLRREGERVRLSISDNGKGLAPAEGSVRPSLGLVGMRARARQCGGELTVSSAASKEGASGRGVQIEASVPVERSEDAE